MCKLEIFGVVLSLRNRVKNLRIQNLSKCLNCQRYENLGDGVKVLRGVVYKEMLFRVLRKQSYENEICRIYAGFGVLMR